MLKVLIAISLLWCQQITQNSLGGVVISFIDKMDPTLFQQLQTCLNSSPPTTSGCKSTLVQSGDIFCCDIANAQCGDGNDWSTELFQDPNCSIPINQLILRLYASCSNHIPNVLHESLSVLILVTYCVTAYIKEGKCLWLLYYMDCSIM